jgi:DNA-directed RNA polymerase III subunit RPC3
MIQHSLVFHFTSLDDGSTYYEANPHAAYYLVRSGKILQLVENRLGKYAAQILEAIMFLGHASIAHLETLPELAPNQQIPNANGVNHDGDNTEENDEQAEANGQENGEHAQENGDHEEENGVSNGNHVENMKPARFHPTIKSLASHGYILKVREAHFQSPNDNILEARRIISSRPDVKQMKGKQQAAEIEEKTQTMVKERTEGDLSRGLMFNGVPQGVKRKRGHGNSESRKQTNGTNGVKGDHGNEEDEENDWSDDEDGLDSMPMDVSLSRIQVLSIIPQLTLTADTSHCSSEL